MFYDAINVRAERCEGSQGEKYSRGPFYICALEGIPGRRRSGPPQEEESLMF